MRHLLRRAFHAAWAAAVVTAYIAGFAAARPAQAQATVSAEAGLDRYYKPEGWVPVQVQLTNAGAAVRVEARARFLAGTEGTDEYILPARDLQPGANQVHTLYLKAPASYSTQQIQVDLLRDGRQLNRVRPNTVQVTDGDWLAVGVGGSETSLKLLTTVTLAPQQLAPGTRNWMSRGQPVRVNVAVLDPARVPDRWQGLDAADMLVLGDVSERSFTAEQMGAIRDYVQTGGMLVVTGGVNWNRLTSPFFADLLPVRVTGGRTLDAATELGPFLGRPGPSGTHAVCAATPKPGAEVKASQDGVPLVVRGTRGSGQVVFLAFDPSLAPYRNWDAVGELWKSVMVQPGPPSVLNSITFGESPDYYYGSGMNLRLADAPFAISQLDIPAFYIVALFLLAYIIVLVPVNYYLLKAKDKKEYAWLTTPAIVAVFSLGAYMIGYGFKGGRTLMVKVGVLETHSGSDAAASLTYAGLFSPRKTGYDIRLAGDNARAADAGSVLISEPPTTQYTPGMRVIEGDAHRVEDFAVDMWAMRVLQAQGVTRLGKGITATWRKQGNTYTGTVRNDSPLTLEDCRVVVGNSTGTVPALPPGGQAAFEVSESGGSGTILPTSMLGEVQGNGERERMRRAVLRALCAPSPGTSSSGWKTPPYPLLVGWARDPAVRFQVNGRPPREQAATLMVVHLDGR